MGILERLRQVQHFGRAEFGVRELAGDAADVITHLTAELESVTAEFEEHMTGEGLSLFEKLCAAEAELESTKIKYADCARLLEDAGGRLAEARNDTDRLDWLEKHREFYANLRLMKAKGSYYEWQIVSDEGVWYGHTIREAIDAGEDSGNG